MVQTLINEVRRLGTEQNNNLQEIQRLRAEQFLPTPPVEPSEGEGPPPPAPPAGRGIIDTRIGKPPVFSGDENTWGDWSFKLRSYVSVVDLQLGQMMEAAELAAHANAWLPSVPLNQDMDAQLRYLLVMLTSGPALQIIRQQPSGVQAFRDLARRYNPRSQARSLAQLQELIHFDFGQEPAGVTDRLIVFERLVGEYEISSGEVLGVQVKCAVLLERVPSELRTQMLLTCGSRPDYAIMRQTVESYSVAKRSWQPSHSTSMGEAPMEIDAVYGDKGKKGKHGKGKKGKDKGKGKHKGKHESSPKFEGYCGHCGKWGHKQKDYRYKNTVAEVDDEESVEPPNRNASSSTNRVTPPPPGLFSAGTAPSTTGTISTLMEDHAQSGWLCELVGRSDDTKWRENEFVELLVDTGATEHVCGPQDFTHAELTSGPRPALKTATGELVKHYSLRTVDFRCQGEELRVGFTVVDVKRPILSVSRLMDRGIETFIQTGKQSLRRYDGATVELTRRGGLFVLQCQVAVPMLLAPVDDEPAGVAPDLPPVDEEMERELMGREEAEPPVAIEVPAPGEPTSDERRHHGLTHLPYQSWCNVCVRARGRENRHESRSQVQPGTPVIQCDYCFLKTEEDAPMITVLLAIDRVYKQMVAIPLEKKGNRDPFASRSLAAFARYVGHPKVIIQGDSEHALMAVIHDACALLTAATPRTCEQQGLKWSSRESSTIR